MSIAKTDDGLVETVKLTNDCTVNTELTYVVPNELLPVTVIFKSPKMLGRYISTFGVVKSVAILNKHF